MKIKTKILATKFCSLYSTFDNGYIYNFGGYYDKRHNINTTLTQLIMLFVLPILCSYSLNYLILLPTLFFGYGDLFIYLPFKSKKDNSQYPRIGFCIHNSMFWIYLFSREYYYQMFYAYVWYRTSVLDKDENWITETVNNRKYFYNKDIWGDKIYSKKFPYTHTFEDGSKCYTKVEIKVEEKEYRRLLLSRVSLFSKIERCAYFSFQSDLEDSKDTINVYRYIMKKNERPLECLRRFRKDKNKSESFFRFMRENKEK